MEWVKQIVPLLLLDKHPTKFYDCYVTVYLDLQVQVVKRRTFPHFFIIFLYILALIFLKFLHFFSHYGPLAPLFQQAILYTIIHSTYPAHPVWFILGDLLVGSVPHQKRQHVFDRP